MSGPVFRPRRSCLYVPGANARAMEKAAGLGADAIVLDLEDAVAPEAKEDARKAVIEWLRTSHFAGERVVRINGLDTQWGAADLAALLPAGADGLLAPKVRGAGDVAALAQAMAGGAGTAGRPALWLMIETPQAILRLDAIGAALAAMGPGGALVLGLNDLAKETGALPTPDRSAFAAAMAMTLAGARAHGLSAIDGVCNAISDAAQLESECRAARTLGYDGKSLIHPAQVDAANRLFAPEPDAVAEAEAIIAAFADPANAGKGVIKVDGRMAERLHLAAAERLVALARAIAAR